MNPVIVFLVFMAIAIIAFLAGRQEHKSLVASDLRGLKWYRRMYLEKQGCTTLVPNANPYHLLSIDGGRTWLAIDTKRNLLGRAEEACPGLLEHLDGFDNLIAYIEKHGPIGSAGKITDEDIKVLQGAGFEVKQGQ